MYNIHSLWISLHHYELKIKVNSSLEWKHVRQIEPLTAGRLWHVQCGEYSIRIGSWDLSISLMTNKADNISLMQNIYSYDRRRNTTTPELIISLTGLKNKQILAYLLLTGMGWDSLKLPSPSSYFKSSTLSKHWKIKQLNALLRGGVYDRSFADWKMNQSAGSKFTTLLKSTHRWSHIINCIEGIR